MSLSVKEASKNDISLLASLGAKTFYDTFHMHHSKEDMNAYLEETYTEKAIQKAIDDTTIHYAVAYNVSTPLGYIKLKRASTHKLLSGKQIELEKIYVAQNELGKGTGKLLMDYALDYAKSHQFDVMFLGVWEENKRAVAFYKKYGFEVFATRTFKLGTNLCDDFLMKLEL